MELDDLKTAWQTLDRRLDAQTALNLHMFKDGKLDKARRGLRPLAWGQALQILCGIALIEWAVSFWSAHRDVPHLLLAGISVHVYGVLMIICGGATIGLISRIDYAAPVLAIQKQLGQLRRFYVRTNVGLGLAWWFLWMPIVMMLFMSAFGADLYANAPSVIYAGTAIGAAGLLLTFMFDRWVRHPSRPAMAKMVDDSVAGGSLNRAQRVLDEIAQFEQN
jgi:serine/threonine-protein kinase